MKFSFPFFLNSLLLSSLLLDYGVAWAKTNKKGKKDKEDNEPNTAPRKRNLIVSPPGSEDPSIYKLGGNNMKIGKLVETLYFNFTSHIIVGDGKPFDPPYNQIYERCLPFPTLNLSDAGHLQAGQSLQPDPDVDQEKYKGGCNGGIMKGDLNGLYLAGEYQAMAPAHSHHYALWPTDFVGPLPPFVQPEYVPPGLNPYKDNSRQGWPTHSVQLGAGWLYTDVCNKEGKEEWLVFNTIITSINSAMHLPGSNKILSTNVYAMDKERSRGCEDYYLSFSLIGTDYSNPKSIPYLGRGFGCPEGACTVIGHKYKMEQQKI